MNKKISLPVKAGRGIAFRSTVSAFALAGASLAVLPALAVEVPVSDGTNLNTLTPASDDVWNLQGNAFLSDGSGWLVKALPNTMTINGVAGGSIITMDDGAGHSSAFGFVGAPWPQPSPTLNLSNVTFVTQNEALSTQGAYNSVVNISNKVAFTGTSTSGYNGSIYVAYGVVMNGLTGSTLSMSGNAYGFYASIGDTTFTGSYDRVDISNNNVGVFGKGDSVIISGDSYGTIHLDTNYIAADVAKDVIINPTIITGDISISNNARGGISANNIVTIAPGTVNGILALNNNGGRTDPARWNTASGAINAGGSITISGAYRGIEMIGNKAFDTYDPMSGGALSAGRNYSWGSPADVSVTPSAGTMAVRNNSATLNGGAFAANRNVTVSAGGATDFTGNAAAVNGGAIWAKNNAALAAAGGSMSFSGNSAGGKGGAIWAGGDVTLDAVGGDITFSNNIHGDPVANAIWFDNTVSGATAAFNADVGRTITFFDPIQNNDVNGLMTVNKTGTGTLSFDGSLYSSEAERWSKMLANTTVSAGTFEVANNAVYGSFSPSPKTPTSLTSAAGTTVQGGHIGTILADNITLNGDVSLAGRQQSVRGVFNISTSNLTLGGGTFHFNTYLDDGKSGDTDLLVLNLNGSAVSGQSFISVTNAGGNGALTLGNGIKLVETNGTGTTAGAFVLNGRVAAGAYEYQLFHGGVGSDAGDENWYLRSTYTPPPPPPPQPPSPPDSGSETDNPNPQPAPQPKQPDPQPVPIIRAEVPVSMAIPPLAIEYGYAMLGTVHERAGETYLNDSGPVAEERTVWCKDPKASFKCVVRVPVATANGAMTSDETHSSRSGWARLMGDRGFHNPDNFEKLGPNYDYILGGIQAGFDIYAREQADGTLDKAGIYVGYGQITSNVKGQFGSKAGTVDMDAYTLAGYWTHHAPQGWYTDAVIQGTWYSGDAKSIYNQSTKPEGFGILGSLEGGYAFKLGNGFTLEPQAQIVYQNVSFNQARDGYGFVRFDDGESLRGRLGLRMTKTWNTADQGREPRMVNAWLRANVWHEFMGKTKTSWGSLDGQNITPFHSTLGGTWGEIGVGVTAQASDKVNIFATGAYNRSLDNKGREGWDGRVGMTVKW